MNTFSFLRFRSDSLLKFCVGYNLIDKENKDSLFLKQEILNNSLIDSSFIELYHPTF